MSKHTLVNLLIAIFIVIPACLYWEIVGLAVIYYLFLAAWFPILIVPVVIFFCIPRIK